jgi:hypothetical protein
VALKEIAESIARSAGKKAAESVAKRASKAESVAAGLYHPIGGGLKLKKPIAEMTETTIANPDVTMTAPKILTPEDLYGKAGIPLIGDRAATGKILTHIDDRPLNRPVTLEGGPEFMLAHHYPEDPMGSSVWASGKGKVTALNNRIREAAESGDDVLGIYSAGSPVQVDYNAMLSHALANQIDLGAIKKSDIKKFNASIRADHPDFLGIEHPDLDLQLGQKNAGPLRTHFVNRMALSDFQDAGFPNIAQARKAITEPELIDVPLGSTGFMIGKMSPEGAIVESPRMPHGTYPIHMQGTPEGRLETQLPYDVMFKTHTDARKMLPGAKLQTVYRSYELTQPIQYFDQEWLDNAMKYMESLKGKEYADGGEVLKEEPRGAVSGAIADVLKPASEFLGQYEIDKRIPFVGGSDLADLTGIKGTQTLAEDISRGYSPVHGGSVQTATFDPRLVDAAGLIPGVGQLMKLGKNLGKTAVKEGMRQIETGTGMLGRNVIDPRHNIIKDPGGMLVGGEKELDNELINMKKNEVPNFNIQGIPFGEIWDRRNEAPKDPHAVALNGWIDTKVKKYIRNQAGTESDPILKAIESGVEHKFDPLLGDTKYYTAGKREMVGKPKEGIAKTDLGKEWEYKVDSIFKPTRAEEIKNILSKQMPEGNEGYKNASDKFKMSLLRMDHDLPINSQQDLENLKLINHIPDEHVYSLAGTNITRKLGLDHVADVLYEDLASGKLTPEQLNQMSIEKAIRRTADYDKEKVKIAEKAEADRIKDLPMHRQYDDGYRWIELKHPTDDNITKEALKSEGDQMGHCVGGPHYFNEVLNGNTKIISLRDANNKPHVTIEALPKNYRNSIHDPLESWTEIEQIKGKANQKPKEQYQKYITDFIQNPTFGNEIAEVRDLHNTNLYDVNDIASQGLVSKDVHFHPDTLKATKARNPNYTYGMSPEQEEMRYDLFKDVGNDLAKQKNYYPSDEDILNHIRSKYLTPAKAKGGPINLEQEYKLRRAYG